MSGCRVKRKGLRVALNVHAASGEYGNCVSWSVFIHLVWTLTSDYCVRDTIMGGHVYTNGQSQRNRPKCKIKYTSPSYLEYLIIVTVTVDNQWTSFIHRYTDVLWGFFHQFWNQFNWIHHYFSVCRLSCMSHSSLVIGNLWTPGVRSLCQPERKRGSTSGG